MTLHIVALVLLFLSGGFAAVKGGDPDHAQLYAAIVAAIGTLSTLLAALAPALKDAFKGNKPPNVAGMMMTVVVGIVCLWTLFIVGCISSAPIVPVTPANQAQVASCQGIASSHNALVIGDFVVSGTTPVLAGIAAGLPSADTGARTALGVAAVTAGAIAMTSSGLVAYTASDFANSKCSDVVGALPPMPAASAKPSADLFPRPGETVTIVSAVNP